MGPRRRRAARRLDQRVPELHLHERRRVHGHAAGDRHQRRVRRGHRDDQRRRSGPPTPTINTPAAGTTWGVGQSIALHAAPRPTPRTARCRRTALDWQLILHHCTSPGNCHQHTIEGFENTAGGTFVAPDHEYPSHLELRLTATDSHNNTATVSRQLDPRTISITAASDPPGMTVSLGVRQRHRAGHRDGHRGLRQHAQRSVAAGQRTTRPTSSRPGPTARPRRTTSRRRSSTTYTARFAPRTPGTSTLTFNPERRRAASSRPTPTIQLRHRHDQLRTDAGANPDVESYLRFIVDGLTGKVQSAKLRLRSTAARRWTGRPGACPTSNSWGGDDHQLEQQAGPDRRGRSPTRARSRSIEWVEWDVTPAVTARRRRSASGWRRRDHRRRQLPLARVGNRDAAAGAGGDRAERLLPAAEAARLRCGSPWCPPTTPARARTARTGPRSRTRRATRPRSRRRELTVGTPDANGQAANSSGIVKLSVIPGIPGTPEDEADVSVGAVAHGRAQRDRPRRLRGRAAAARRPQDHGPRQRARARPVRHRRRISTCRSTLPARSRRILRSARPAAWSTTFDAVLPGVIDEGERSVWEIGQIEVLDGGPDGDVDTPGNGVFARQGVFVP